MVGTRRTNSCETCRTRKVKCDEKRPVCGQCAIKGRKCKASSPPQLSWVKNGQLSLPEELVATCTAGKGMVVAPDAITLSLVKSHDKPSGAAIHVYRAESLNQAGSAGSLLNQDIPSTPGMSATDRLRSELMQACCQVPVGYRLSSLNVRLTCVPRHLGTSTVLDRAARALLQTHASIIKGEKSGGDTVMYLDALRSLQQALARPHIESKSAILCAVVLLSYVELLGYQPRGTGYIRHAGGVSALIKAAGSRGIAGDELGKEMVQSCAGSIIVDSIVNRKECYLDAPEWAWVFAETESEGYPKEKLQAQTMWQFAKCASLLHELRYVLDTDAPTSKALSVLQRLLELRSQINSAKSAFERLLHPNRETLPPGSNGTPDDDNFAVDSVSWFHDVSSAHVTTRWWALVILVNGMLDRVHKYLCKKETEAWDEGFIEGIRSEARLKGDLIFNSIECANQYRPIASAYLSFPLYAAWTVVSENRKEKLVEQIGGLLCGDIPADYRCVLLDYTAGVLLS